MATNSKWKIERKVDTLPEPLLDRLLRTIEDDDHPERYTQALNDLLRYGPYRCTEVDRENALLLRLEILAYLRSVVRTAGRPSYVALTISDPITFRASRDEHGHVEIFATGTARALTVLQLQTTLKMVGMKSARTCAASDCQKMFVRYHKQIFCSSGCQVRENKRQQRRAARDQKRAQQQARHRAVRRQGA